MISESSFFLASMTPWTSGVSLNSLDFLVLLLLENKEASVSPNNVEPRFSEALAGRWIGAVWSVNVY